MEEKLLVDEIAWQEQCELLEPDHIQFQQRLIQSGIQFEPWDCSLRGEEEEEEAEQIKEDEEPTEENINPPQEWTDAELKAVGDMLNSGELLHTEVDPHVLELLDKRAQREQS